MGRETLRFLIWGCKSFYSLLFPPRYRDRLELSTELFARAPHTYRQHSFTPSLHSTAGLKKFCGLYRRKAEAAPISQGGRRAMKDRARIAPRPRATPGHAARSEASSPANARGCPGPPRPRTWRPARGPAASWWRLRRRPAGSREGGRRSACARFPWIPGRHRPSACGTGCGSSAARRRPGGSAHP